MLDDDRFKSDVLNPRSMVAPVTHMLVPMILVDVYRRFVVDRKFSYWYVLLAGFFGALPDMDIAFSFLWTEITGRNVWLHRMWSHSLFIPLGIVMLGIIFYVFYRKNVFLHRKYTRAIYTALFVAGFALVTHTMLDFINGPGYILYPFEWSFFNYSIIPNEDISMIVDGLMLTLWLLLDDRVLGRIVAFLNRKKTR